MQPAQNNTPVTEVNSRQMANAIRALAMDAVEKAASGHPGMPMGMADVATVLFTQFMHFDPANPRWVNRDRFVLSAGHGSMLLYALSYLLGYSDITLDDIQNFRGLHRPTAGHPEFGEAGIIDTTTGPLGQGLANAVGMALAEKILHGQFGEKLVNHSTYCIAGDGCLMEGIAQESITLAAHLNLHKLIVLFDDNKISIDGATSLATSEDQIARFDAAGWHTAAIDGHDTAAIAAAIAAAREANRPSLIACRTTIAFGAPTKAGTAKSHGSPLGAEEIAGARAKLEWPHAAFDIPADILGAWRAAGARGEAAHTAWQKNLGAAAPAARTAFNDWQAGTIPAAATQAIHAAKNKFIADGKAMATRAASGAVLELLTPAMPNLIGGSADLSESNNTKTKTHVVVTAGTDKGNYIHYGIREHAMAAAMNGMALHGGLVPYGATFLVFTDYCRPAIRLAALMKQRVIYIMTHDSIGLGEDGPTHQPVEHLAALRVIPNLHVCRPADAVEVAECWEHALKRVDGPTLLSLSRQALPILRGAGDDNLSARGAYVLHDVPTRDVTLLATGSEVEIALSAAKLLAADGVQAAVVSMPCWEAFEQQDENYRIRVLGTAPRVAVEAASPFGWTRYVENENDVVGMTSFGASAPAKDLYNHFGITAAQVAAKAKLKR